MGGIIDGDEMSRQADAVAAALAANPEFFESVIGSNDALLDRIVERMTERILEDDERQKTGRRFIDRVRQRASDDVTRIVRETAERLAARHTSDGDGAALLFQHVAAGVKGYMESQPFRANVAEIGAKIIAERIDTSVKNVLADLLATLGGNVASVLTNVVAGAFQRASLQLRAKAKEEHDEAEKRMAADVPFWKKPTS